MDQIDEDRYAGWRWVLVQHDRQLPQDVVLVGHSCVGRRFHQIGQVDISADGAQIVSFNGQAEIQSVEILCCKSSVSWATLRRGDAIPFGAVMAGVTKTDGLTYVARLDGNVGKINTRKGNMWNFWGPKRGDHGAVGKFMSRLGIRLVDEASSIVAEVLVVHHAQPQFVGQLKVLQFNIWQEGTQVSNGLEKIADVIAAADVDVVALSEVRNYAGADFHERVKAALAERGHIFHGMFVHEGANDVGLLSRYPIERAEPVSKMPTDVSSKVVAYHLRVPNPICIVSAHLGWRNYVVNLPRGYGDGSVYSLFRFGKLFRGPITDPAILCKIDAQSNRVTALQDFITYAKALDAHTPVILAGDLNECSHLDWIEETKDLYGHNGCVIPWLNSQTLQGHGFVDSWRELYPSPVTHPGTTWPSEACGHEAPQPSWCADANECDRIDFVYHNRELRVTNAQLVGSSKYVIEGKCEDMGSQCPFLEDVKKLPWPSDHKAVRAEFELSSGCNSLIIEN
eukprot:TRINITY_DN13996_c0_g2_i1.p1 TRINITY_DN13996_c0_g2~~TRINITY_DN13996_c0_g2_i1.p1  ORF type:complete len:527 (-),score=55.60 TRINITY_DN13996_c0_g2_i1:77-1606(-)